MKLLQELLQLNEAPVVAMELRDVIKNFPNKHGKALAHLMGNGRLMWHGDKNFIETAEEAVKEYSKSEEYGTECHLEFYDEDGDRHTISWEEKLDEADMQQVYVAYDPKQDKLYVGYDAWTETHAFEEAFNEYYEQKFGEEADVQAEELYEAARESYKQDGLGFWGLMFEVDAHGNAMEARHPVTGGFYKSMYHNFKNTSLTGKRVIDLRLD